MGLHKVRHDWVTFTFTLRPYGWHFKGKDRDSCHRLIFPFCLNVASTGQHVRPLARSRGTEEYTTCWWYNSGQRMKTELHKVKLIMFPLIVNIKFTETEMKATQCELPWEKRQFFPLNKEHNVNMKSTVDTAKDNTVYQQKSGRVIINTLSIFHRK